MVEFVSHFDNFTKMDNFGCQQVHTPLNSMAKGKTKS
jgi:hypothetical protein